MQILANSELIRITPASPTLHGCDAQTAAALGSLAGCGVDHANSKLRNGTATKAEGLAYVERWNRPGHRLTVARLAEYSVPFGETGMMIPEIRLSEPKD